jgi:REP element-mobilizing transposase RayT
MRDKRPRLDPLCYIGLRRYFVTICCDYRHSAFTSESITQAVIARFLRAAGEEQMAIIAYICMPDHAHALVEGLTDSSDLQSFMHRAKQLTGFEYKKLMGRRLWQPSYDDRVLRNEDATWDVVRYICDNPVRKGMVRQWDEYPFTGSGIMTRAQMAAELAQHPSRRWRP